VLAAQTELVLIAEGAVADDAAAGVPEPRRGVRRPQHLAAVLYKSTFAEDITHSEGNEEIYGALSFVFWTLTLIPLLKYVTIVLRADDNGEGMYVRRPPLAAAYTLTLQCSTASQLCSDHLFSLRHAHRRHVRALLPHMPPRQCQPPPQPTGRRRGALHLQAGAPARGRREVRHQGLA